MKKLLRTFLQRLPEPNQIISIQEPWVGLDIIVPKSYMGNVIKLSQDKRGVYCNTEYLSSDGDNSRVLLHYEMPLSAILTDFYDKIKSVSAGYASISYSYLDYRLADVVKLDILVAEEPIESLATIVYRDEAYQEGRGSGRDFKK